MIQFLKIFLLINVVNSMIRITGGQFRSRLLKTPNSLRTKPTMDKVRQGVFSSIGDEIINANVLDLFAGSGSYGFESLSRGANKVTFVDKGHEQIKIIKDNARALKINDLATIVCSDVLSFLKETKEQYDIIFVDPPYKLDIYYRVIDLILNCNILKDGGILVLESEVLLNVDEDIFRFKILEYGTAKIHILRRE